MCGLVGIAGQMTAKDDAIIKRLLMYDYFRGPDSTGLAAIRGNGDVYLAKIASDPVTLFDTGKFKSAISSISRVYMGHNRAATRGLINNHNAHPIEYDHIIGAHNGTLDQFSWDRLEKAIDEKFPVDSQALIAAIAKLGVKDAIELCTEGRDTHTGAWSLTWFDKTDNSINFLRNKHRPMWIAHAKDFRRILWASEWWMLEAAGRAENFEYLAEGKEGFRFFPTDENVHYKFDTGLFASASAKVKPKTKPISGREPLPVVSTVGVDPFGRGISTGLGNACGVGNVHQIHTRELGETNSTTTSPGTTLLSPSNYLNWFGTPSHPYAGYIDEKKFEELAKYGCTWCSTTVDYGEPGVTIFETEQLVLCPSCSGHEVVDDDAATRIYVTNSNFNALRA